MATRLFSGTWPPERNGRRFMDTQISSSASRSLPTGEPWHPGPESIIIWDVETRRTRSALLGRYGMVSALRFAPGGQALASGYTNGMVRLWDLANGKCQELMGSNLENHSILGVAFSPDGLMLAAGSMTRGTRLWNVATSQESAMFQNEDENVLQVAFSSNGQMLIEVTHGQIVRLRDVASGSTRTLPARQAASIAWRSRRMPGTWSREPTTPSSGCGTLRELTAETQYRGRDSNP